MNRAKFGAWSFCVVGWLLIGLVGCRDAETESRTKAAPPAARTNERRSVVVFAAASLRKPFQQLEAEFESSRPGADLVFQFAGSQELRTQIEHGATADVFASADTSHVETLARAELVTEPVLFARNELVVAVSRTSTPLATFLDLPNAEKIVVGAPDVPIGRYTARFLDSVDRAHPGFRARVEAHVVSRELNVKQVLTKVALGEADAGVVYASDLDGARDVRALAVPSEFQVIAEYPVAVLRRAPHPDDGRAFVALLSSERGQKRLVESGFTGIRLESAGP